MRTNPSFGQRGMTLIEVAVGSCVLALVLGGSLSVMQRNYRLLAEARDLSIATQLLQNEVEQLRAVSWTAVDALTTAATTVTLDSAFTANAQIGNRFTLVRTKSTVTTDVVEFVYTARWTGVDGKTHARSIRTYYARHGLKELFDT